MIRKLLRRPTLLASTKKCQQQPLAQLRSYAEIEKSFVPGASLDPKSTIKDPATADASPRNFQKDMRQKYQVTRHHDLKESEGPAVSKEAVENEEEEAPITSGKKIISVVQNTIEDMLNDDNRLITFRERPVGEVLAAKSKKMDRLLTLRETDTVYQAIQMMEKNRIGALMVLGEQGELVGIFSERDYMTRVFLKGLGSKTTAIKDVMTSKLVTVTPDVSCNDVMNLMTNHKIRHIPVLYEGKLVDILSMGDVVKFILQEQKETIDNMRDYIERTY